MTLDLNALGFKCGLEIHQRLATPTKLFCDCHNGGLSEQKPDGWVKRRLRAAAGELGQVDPAAAFEAAKGVGYQYQTFDAESCLVELDEEPPPFTQPCGS